MLLEVEIRQFGREEGCVRRDPDGPQDSGASENDTLSSVRNHNGKKCEKELAFLSAQLLVGEGISLHLDEVQLFPPGNRCSQCNPESMGCKE